MTLPYIPRLVCLSAACFFLIYLVTALAIALHAPLAIRFSGRLSLRRAATLLLTLRLLPFGIALCSVLGLCVPSYLWLEPEPFDEPVGVACLLASLLGLALGAAVAARAACALFRSFLFALRCRKLGSETSLAECRCPVWVLETSAPCLALMGIARPRVVMSRSIVNALSEEELSVVLSHEGAHLSAFDNLKRLCILLAPGSGALERAWMGCAEYAADRQAVRGDIRRSLALASALVRVARFARTHELSPVATSFFANESNISARVDRLLAEVPSVEPAPRGGRYRFAAALAFIGIVFQPATLRLVHSLLERFVR